MHLRTRQRVIGLLLLLLLAAILAPLVLRTPEQVRLALDMSIPEAPRISEPDIAPVVSEEEQAATDRQIDEEQQQVAAAEPEPQVAPPVVEEEPSADEEPSAEDEPQPATQDAPQPGFTVQVASFSDVANAQALVARLREAGYSAYHREVRQDGNTWQRVFVGPEIKRDRAEALRQRLADDKAFALEGLVRSFVP
ncbi:MAG: SPOR domain-containing protein [Alloalcanivorax venustensis]|uniref:SPOR domain-containing protein n=1 Tax=Alloalcanivorax venustensis TaxID=172371 RepID=UPI003298D6DF